MRTRPRAVKLLLAARRLPRRHMAAASTLLEVERKFACAPALETAIAAAAEGPAKHRTLLDTYYDASPPALPLLRRDWWLRRRNEVWELKVPATPLSERLLALQRAPPPAGTSAAAAPIDRYVEVIDEAEIAARLDELAPLPPGSAPASLGDSISRRGLAAFAAITTRRRSYRLPLGGATVSVDVDDVQFESGSTYALAEVEVLVAPSAGSEGADALIAEFLAAFAVPRDVVVLGKVLEYLRRERPEHAAAAADIMLLKQAGAARGVANAGS